MHLIALSWDVDRPGQPDPAVLALARAVVRQGITCEVLTLGEGPTATRGVDGVDVTWVAEAPPVMPPGTDDDLSRVLAAASRVSAIAERRCRAHPPDAVLAFGWQTAWTATTLRASRGLPLVAVLDSTAPGRADGELDDAGRLEAQVEWWLTYESRRVVVPTDDVRRQLRRAYRLPAAKVDVVPAGVSPAPPTAGTGVRVVGTSALARRVRAALGSAATPRPGIVVGIDDTALRATLDAMATGAAVVVPDDGSLRGLVHAGRSGIRTTRDRTAVVTAVRDLQRDPESARPDRGGRACPRGRAARLAGRGGAHRRRGPRGGRAGGRAGGVRDPRPAPASAVAAVPVAAPGRGRMTRSNAGHASRGHG